ncbi:GntR family transcriptional regulator [Aliidongia dinghuensis]|uniref:GntR family transcriptional regulator n=1 Tax=Aliidongia dinghuensis TaxID=1867774 RepID=A0A8J2YS40_9PROT|nr:GntR family transcriptional regulator [Aliidongia dinghuensis]GGF10235.1 GntR family transcriptional regulator [Aliidongia dinghuensis]
MSDVKPASQMDQAYRQMRHLILSLELMPGEKLSERWLETRFAGSRTPIRAALARLETEGLVTRDGRSYAVAPIDVGELDHLFAFREAIESASVRLACARSLEDMAEEIEAIDAMLDSCGPDAELDDWHRVGNEFHVALARLSGNPFFIRTVTDIMTRLSRARWLEIWSESARATAWAEHHGILDRVKARDADGAAALTAQHVRKGRERMMRSIGDERRALRARGFAVRA